MNDTRPADPSSAPINPHLVLVAAIILPGSGQVINREPVRGLVFVFFIVLLGAYTLKTAAPFVSLVGRFGGGLFVWGMAFFAAYKRARIRFGMWRHARARR